MTASGDPKRSSNVPRCAHGPGYPFGGHDARCGQGRGFVMAARNSMTATRVALRRSSGVGPAAGSCGARGTFDAAIVG